MSSNNRVISEDEMIRAYQILAANKDTGSGVGEPKTSLLEYANYVPLTLFSLFLDTDKREKLTSPLSIFYKLSLVLGLAVVYFMCGFLSFISYYYGSQNYNYILTSIAWWFLMFFVIIMLFPIKPVFESKPNIYLSRISSR
jgi:vacuolar-type H+-ATPase subunit I/STV1